MEGSSMALRASIKIFCPTLVAGLFLILGIPAGAAEDKGDNTEISTSSYELGQGLRLGDTGFTLGGYSSLQFQDLENSDSRASLAHVSLFVWWEGESRLKFFSEIDSQNLLSADQQSDRDDERFLSVERLYFEYTLNDALTLRAGKFLTPIGHWNQIHADPLVWTTSRPLITVNLFPDHITGGMALGNVEVFGRQAEYMLYTSVGTDVRPDPAEDPFNEGLGGRLNFPYNDNLQLGFSLASFDQIATSEEHEELVGADFIWSSRGYEFSGEAAYRRSSYGPQHDANGGFLQGVMPLYGKLFAVGRIEAIHNPDLEQDTRLFVLGLNYRRNRAMSFKLEFVHGINQAISAPGLLSSVSVLF
jgi:hypothetical protein